MSESWPRVDDTGSFGPPANSLLPALLAPLFLLFLNSLPSVSFLMKKEELRKLKQEEEGRREKEEEERRKKQEEAEIRKLTEGRRNMQVVGSK